MIAATNEIILTSDSLIADIQGQFNSFYPFLKIEFSRSSGISTEKKQKLEAGYCIKDLFERSGHARLNVDKNRTIAQIAGDCMHKLGLYIRVFRKSGNVWNVISLTDSWTLENQNKAGQFISSEMTGPDTPVY